MKLPSTRGDRAGHITDELRSAIVNGALQPGVPIRQEELARSYGSSRMPVREALRTLSAEGLVRLVPNRGAIVAEIDADDLRETVEMREAAEVLAIRLAVPQLSNAQIDAASAIHDEIATAEMRAFGRLNKAFHLALYGAAARPRLLSHIASLHDASERYLRFTLSQLDYRSRSAGEHEAILDACYRRDVDAASTLTAAHIRNAGEALEAFLRTASTDRGGRRLR